MIPLIAPLVGVIATTAVSVAVDNAVKIIAPPIANAALSFGVKAGSAIVGFVAGTYVSRIVTRNVNSLVETVNNDIPSTPTQEDN